MMYQNMPNQNVPNQNMTNLGYVDYQQPKKEIWIISLLKALAYVALYMGLSYALSFVLGVAIGVVGAVNQWTDDQMMDMAYEYSGYLTVVAAVLSIIIIAVVMLIRKKPLAKEFKLNKAKPSVLVLCFITGISLNFTLNIMFSLIPEHILQDYSESMAGAEMGLIPYILAGVITAPIIEEVIFRCFAVSRMKRSMSVWLSVLISSAVFGAVHGHWIQMIYAGILGILLGFVFAFTDSIFPSILIHFGFNIVSLISYIDMESMSEAQLTSFNTVYGLCIIASVPLSAICVTVLMLMIKPKKEKAKAKIIGIAQNVTI